METIKNLLEEREKFLKIREDSWNQESGEWENEPEEIDNLADKIWDLLKENCKTIPIDFILETMTSLGGAPCLLYDDNGNFAVSSDGIQSIPESLDDTDDISITHFVEKKFWKPTVREAVCFYLDEEC